MNLTAYNSKLKTILILSTLYSLFSISLCGCEAFRRKFVRKPKEEKEVKVLLYTQEYESEYSVEQNYKRYFLFWSAANEELINLLNSQDVNRKRRMSLAKRIVADLEQMRQFLLPEKQSQLDVFILRQKDIIRQLDKYNLKQIEVLRIKNTLEKHNRQIQKDFNFKQVQEYLIKQNINADK